MDRVSPFRRVGRDGTPSRRSGETGPPPSGVGRGGTLSEVLDSFPRAEPSGLFGCCLVSLFGLITLVSYVRGTRYPYPQQDPSCYFCYVCEDINHLFFRWLVAKITWGSWVWLCGPITSSNIKRG